jgi:SAM-dependent methyltransferase
MSIGLPALRAFARRNVVSAAARMRPSAATKLLTWWLTGVAAGEPRSALRRLLQVEELVWQYVDAAAIRYDAHGLHVKHRLMGYHAFFVSRLAPGERVLNVGCGNGAVAYSMAAEAGALVTGIDVSEEQVASAKSRYRCDGLEFVIGDATDRIPNGRYDTAVLSNVLEHIDDRHTFLGSLIDHTGVRRLLIRVPMWDRHWVVPMRQELGLTAFSDPGHFVEYTESCFREEMSAAGLDTVSLTVRWGEIWAEVRPVDAR